LVRTGRPERWSAGPAADLKVRAPLRPYDCRLERGRPRPRQSGRFSQLPTPNLLKSTLAGIRKRLFRASVVRVVSEPLPGLNGTRFGILLDSATTRAVGAGHP
jgi:hypothetical protein